MSTYKKLRKFCIWGVIFVAVLGALMHSLYEWTGNNIIVGLFCPISESFWEHLKIGFYPMLIFALIGYNFVKYEAKNYIFGVGFSSLILSLCVFITFFIYTSLTGESIIWLDLAFYIIAIIIAFYVFHLLMYAHELPRFFKGIGIAIILLSILCFSWFSLKLSTYDLFEEPDTSTSSVK